MRFTFDDEQQLFASTVREFLEKECTPEDVRAVWESGQHDAGRWRALAELGVVGMTVPAGHGGLGMDEIGLVLLLEEAGRAVLPEPLLEVTAVAAPLLTDVGGRVADEWLPTIATGEAVVVPVLDGDPYPAHAAAADLLLVQDDGRLLAVPPADARVTPQPNVDGARPTVSVEIGPSDAQVVTEDAGPALVRATQRGAWAAAAMLVGAGRQMLDLATEYATQREQFGKPIGTFQAVKHRLAEALVEVEFARPLVHRAAHSLATGDPETALHVSMAKATAGEAATTAAKAALQVHGAIGYTWEHDLHLWMKRVWSLTAAWGDGEVHWSTIEDDLELGV